MSSRFLIGIASDAPQSWRERYLAAFRSIDEDLLQAAVLLQRVAAERQDDPAPRILWTGWTGCDPELDGPYPCFFTCGAWTRAATGCVRGRLWGG